MWWREGESEGGKGVSHGSYGSRAWKIALVFTMLLVLEQREQERMRQKMRVCGAVFTNCRNLIPLASWIGRLMGVPGLVFGVGLVGDTRN